MGGHGRQPGALNQEAAKLERPGDGQAQERGGPDMAAGRAIEQGKESRERASSPARTESMSAIYFRKLKPVSGSQDGVPMTTDVGPLSFLLGPLYFKVD